jgi:hypothetical protein
MNVAGPIDFGREEWLVGSRAEEFNGVGVLPAYAFVKCIKVILRIYDVPMHFAPTCKWLVSIRYRTPMSQLNPPEAGR